MTRIDKIISQSTGLSRKESAALIHKGKISVNGSVVKDPSKAVSGCESIILDGKKINQRRRIVCIINKPSGFVCSTDDPRDRTITELIDDDYIHQDLLPAGRLDKDTEGLLVLTNDGDLIHRLISPKSEIKKTYLVKHSGIVTDDVIKKAFAGVTLKDGSICKSAVIKKISDNTSTITITEGMYHQVKRMYAALGMHVESLNRIQIGQIKLGTLETGKMRELSEEEINLLLS